MVRAPRFPRFICRCAIKMTRDGVHHSKKGAVLLQCPMYHGSMEKRFLLLSQSFFFAHFPILLFICILRYGFIILQIWVVSENSNYTSTGIM